MIVSRGAGHAWRAMAAPALVGVVLAAGAPASGAALTAPAGDVPAPPTTEAGVPAGPTDALPGGEMAAAAARADALALAVAEDPVTLRRGHVDALAVLLEGPRLRLAVKDDTTGGPVVWRSPASVTFVVEATARTEVPGDPAFGFLGAPGSPVWLLPQVEDRSLLWPGWNTEGVDPAALRGAVRVRLLRADGPGAFALFSSGQFGDPTVLLSSADGLPDEMAVPVGTHAHGNWAFGDAGTYLLAFEAVATLADGSQVSDRATLRFVVGDPAAPPAGGAPAPTTASAGGSGGSGRSGTGGPAEARGRTQVAGRRAGDAGGDSRLAESGPAQLAPLVAVGLAAVAVGACMRAVRRRGRVGP